MNCKLLKFTTFTHKIIPIMKKILASIAAIATLTGFASSAHAGGTNAPGGSTGSATFTSSHAGSVSGTCSLAVTDGVLPLNQGFVSSLTSTTDGTISTVCNTTTSNIKVGINTGTSSAPSQTGYTQAFKLTAGTGAYPTAPTGGAFVASPATYTKTDLSNGLSATPSTMSITAQASVPTTQLLAAGSYSIDVDVTVVP